MRKIAVFRAARVFPLPYHSLLFLRTIRMEDWRREAHLGRSCWVLFAKRQAQEEDAAYTYTRLRPGKHTSSAPPRSTHTSRIVSDTASCAAEPTDTPAMPLRARAAFAPFASLPPRYRPSHAVPSGPKTDAFQMNKLSSDAGLALAPSGGSCVMASRSRVRRRIAAVALMLCCTCGSRPCFWRLAYDDVARRAAVRVQ